MIRNRRGRAALLAVVLFGLVACFDATGPDDREPKDDTDDLPKAERSIRPSSGQLPG